MTRSPSSAPSPLRRRLHRVVVLRRRWLAAGLAGLAVLVALRGTGPPTVPTRAVVVAAHDLPGGGTLAAGDLVVRRVPAGAAPSGRAVTADLGGRTLASPVRAGEVLTDRRVVAPSLVAGYPGLVGVPVRLGEAGVLRLLRPGDVVDVLAAPVRGGGRAWVAAPAARVVTIPTGHVEEATSVEAVGGGLVVLAVPPEQVAGLVTAAATRLLTVTWSG